MISECNVLQTDASNRNVSSICYVLFWFCWMVFHIFHSIFFCFGGLSICATPRFFVHTVLYDIHFVKIIGEIRSTNTLSLLLMHSVHSSYLWHDCSYCSLVSLHVLCVILCVIFVNNGRVLTHTWNALPWKLTTNGF